MILRHQTNRVVVAVARARCCATAIALAKVAPTLLLPLFYRFERLSATSSRTRLLALSNRAGAPVLDVYEWKLGEKTRRRMRRSWGWAAPGASSLSDTLLANHSFEEIEVILAHELAHHVHGDIWRAIASRRC